ncbi:hypothetical protein PV721_30420 [Streptomyces sp. MB09-01]|uniref:hypothetical protein n=1 Tax=Streptomyces sp. MB09-01 TaxID=3028666 RepID=UPI0029A487AE|nr:hypothetical protein [Streptomyces sp. MB09-01]MDX3538584.1 hypothetical protein [Streptomyces sp. MB09-01]
MEHDVSVLKELPADKQREQLTLRLGSLKATGALSADDVVTLEGVADGKVAMAAVPRVVTPDGSPSLCGVIGSVPV